MDELDSKVVAPSAETKTPPVKSESSAKTDVQNGADGQNEGDALGRTEREIEELDPDEVASDTGDVLEGKEPGSYAFVLMNPMLLKVVVQ